MRLLGDSFRNSARAGNSNATLRPVANDILTRYNTANTIYVQLVNQDRRFSSDLFPRIGDATARIMQSVR